MANRTSTTQWGKLATKLGWPLFKSPATFTHGSCAIAISIVLFVLVVCVFFPCLSNGFVNFDDPVYVYENVHVQSGLTWENIRWAFTNLGAGFWQPLTWLSFLLDSQLFGMRPGGYHLTSLLLHAANGVLLFLLFKRMTGALWRSALVAALFALHPLHVEPVAWIASRKDVLSTFFALLALIFYARYAQGRSGGELRVASGKSSDPVRDSHPSTPDKPYPCLIHREADHRLQSVALDYLLSLVFFICGLMSKTMVVTLPFMMLLMDWWPLLRFCSSPPRPQPPTAPPPSILPQFKVESSKFDVGRSVFLRRLPVLLLEKIPFLAAAFAVGLLTMQAEKGAGAVSSAGQFPLLQRVAAAVLLYCRYIGQTACPQGLSVYYLFHATFSLWLAVGAALLLLLVSAAAWRAGRLRPYLMFGWVWYLVTLLPVIGLIQVGAHSHADRYSYVPLIGLFTLLVWGVSDLAARWRFRAILLSFVACAVLLSCLALSRRQLAYWKNGESLFRHALSVDENNFMAHTLLGNALQTSGRLEDAVAHYQRAIALTPASADAHNGLGVALAAQGLLDQAVSQFEQALKQEPDHAEAHHNLGLTFVRQGQLDQSILQFHEALRLKPDFALAHQSLGTVLARKGSADEAIIQCQDALKLKPDLVEAHNSLGLALRRKGLLDQAIPHFQAATALKPDYADAHFNLGTALAKTGHLDEAIAQYQEVLQLNPEYPEIHNNLGMALGDIGRLDEALQHYQQALMLNPLDAVVHCRLGIIFGKQGRFDEAIAHLQEALRLAPGFTAAQKDLDIALALKNASSSNSTSMSKP